MLNTKIMVYIFIGLCLISLADAATIYGSVYDLSLKKINNALVEINTTPHQFLIAQNGSYSFDVPNGFYTIKAQLTQKSTVLASVQENITVHQDGSYVLDLILFPNLEEGVEDTNLEINTNVIPAQKSRNNFFVGFFILLLLILVVVAFYYSKKIKVQKKESEKIEEKTKQGAQDADENLDNLIKIIKQEGGRTTQKDIRKQIPLSEAKISLMIAELEHKGVIEKIKKGRGNIIILKKK